LLKEAVKKYGTNNWRRITEVFDDGRTELQCQLRWQKVLNPNVVKGPWTKEVRKQCFHVSAAVCAVEIVRNTTQPDVWSAMSHGALCCLVAGGRQSDRTCARAWSKEVVIDCGPPAWANRQTVPRTVTPSARRQSFSTISDTSSCGFATPPSWHNHLNPDIKKTPWTEEEDRIILEKHAILGNQWAKIAEFLPGRYAEP
jgi:hypothetical protein